MNFLSEYEEKAEKRKQPSENVISKRKLDNPLADEEKSTESTIMTNHQTKIRQFPHVEGNWPSYVYIEIDSKINDLSVLTADLINEISNTNNIIKYVDEDSFDGYYHISLSKPFTLRFQEIDEFIANISESIKNISRFNLSFQGSTIFSNEDKTRYFISLYILKGTNNVIELISKIDNIMKKYNKPEYYRPSIPHSSIAYSLKELKDSDTDTVESELICIKCINCKIGNKKYNFSLK